MTKEQTPAALVYAERLENFYMGIGRLDAVGAAETLRTQHAALTEWFYKTEWLRKTLKPAELGKHLADVLRERIEALETAPPAQAQTDELLKALNLAHGIAIHVIRATGFDESQVSDWRPVVESAIANAAAPAQEDATQLAGQGPTPEELMALSRECTKMPGGLGMHYQNYARAVLARWGAAPAQALAGGPAGSGGWQHHAESMERDRNYWRDRAETMREQQRGECWHWQGDGGDHIESMANSLPVVIRADVLRALLAEQAPTQAARDVLAERLRQIERKGYDPENDDAHVLGEIGALAALYLMPDGARDWDATSTGYGDTLAEALLPADWTMPKMGNDRRSDLVKGAASALAELERFDREAARAAQGGAA